MADSNIEMVPRQFIASSAYAYKAEEASKADYARKAGEAENVMGQVTVSSSGNVGIGTTSPMGLLDVGGGNLVVDLDSGNVGIGTTNPGATLDIEGDITIGKDKYLTSRFTMHNANWVSGDVAFIVFGPGTSSEGSFSLRYWDPADSPWENRFVMNIGDHTGTKIWADDSGRLRTKHSKSMPTNTTDGTVIGDQTSSLDSKDLQ